MNILNLIPSVWKKRHKRCTIQFFPKDPTPSFILTWNWGYGEGCTEGFPMFPIKTTFPNNFSTNSDKHQNDVKSWYASIIFMPLEAFSQEN